MREIDFKCVGQYGVQKLPSPPDFASQWISIAFLVTSRLHSGSYESWRASDCHAASAFIGALRLLMELSFLGLCMCEVVSAWRRMPEGDV